MSDPTKLVFVGAGGHASVLYDIVTEQNYIVQAIYKTFRPNLTRFQKNTLS